MGPSLCGLSLGGPFPGAQQTAALHGGAGESTLVCWSRPTSTGEATCPGCDATRWPFASLLFVSQAQNPSLVMRNNMSEESQLSDVPSRAPQTAEVIQSKGSLRKRHGPEGSGETEDLSAMRCPG